LRYGAWIDLAGEKIFTERDEGSREDYVGRRQLFGGRLLGLLDRRNR
jgi:hypothetical protein